MDVAAPQSKVLEAWPSDVLKLMYWSLEAYEWRFNLNNSLIVIYIYKIKC